MRLHEFISKNMEAILQQWENFARDVWPGNQPSIRDLRDHAEEMLRAIIADMQTSQSEAERRDKSIGNGQPSAHSDSVDSSSSRHAESRVESGFDLRSLVAEYRALRASVLHLWGQADQEKAVTRFDDMMRFNEAMDQLLAESVLSYTASVDQSRELFLGILGHDLRTPLGAVTMAAGLLEEEKELSGRSRDMVSQIVVSARAMKCLVGDLLDFARIRLGAKLNVTRQSMNLEDLCREVMKEMGAAHSPRVFDFEISGSGIGEWDRQRLRQLVSNLLTNAVQHGAAYSPIRLFIAAEGDEVVFGVRNQGRPIPPGAQAVIFDPLRRCQSADELSRSYGSLGLGLYIAREIAIAHGGSIEVNSDDRETVFIVKLPRAGRKVIR